jgi:hypothetical protein
MNMQHCKVSHSAHAIKQAPPGGVQRHRHQQPLVMLGVFGPHQGPRLQLTHKHQMAMGPTQVYGMPGHSCTAVQGYRRQPTLLIGTQ